MLRYTLPLFFLLSACALPEAANRRASDGRPDCVRMCDRGSDMCMDKRGSDTRHGDSGIGIGAGCERQMRDCLARCRQPAAE